MKILIKFIPCLTVNLGTIYCGLVGYTPHNNFSHRIKLEEINFIKFTEHVATKCMHSLFNILSRGRNTCDKYMEIHILFYRQYTHTMPYMEYHSWLAAKFPIRVDT